jgi:hypothetical protein
LDVKKRFREEQIIGFLREADKGIAVMQLCRKTYTASNSGGTSVPGTVSINVQQQPAPIAGAVTASVLANSASSSIATPTANYFGHEGGTSAPATRSATRPSPANSAFRICRRTRCSISSQNVSFSRNHRRPMWVEIRQKLKR